jgi:hypothetical protein
MGVGEAPKGKPVTWEGRVVATLFARLRMRPRDPPVRKYLTSLNWERSSADDRPRWNRTSSPEWDSERARAACGLRVEIERVASREKEREASMGWV